MLRIEKHSDGCVTRLRLSGRIQSEHIGCIRSAMNDGCACKMLDLSEVTLVDITVVRYLIRCEDEGIELIERPPYGRGPGLRMPPDSIASDRATKPEKGSGVAFDSRRACVRLRRFFEHPERARILPAA